MPTLLDLAQLAVDSARHAGAQWVTAMCATSRHIGVIVENTSIRECEVVREVGIGVRAIIEGGAGFATTDRLDEAAIRRCARNAVALARAAHPDPDFVSLPGPAPALGTVKGLFDPRVAGLEAAEVVRWCRDGIEEARSVDSEVALSGGGDLTVGETALATSTGVAIQRRGTSLGLSFSAVVRRRDDVGSYSEEDEARRLIDLEPHGIGAKATQEALRYLGGRHVHTGRMDLVLGPFVGLDLIASAILAAGAEGVQRGRSYMAGKQGERVASEVVTVSEEPFIEAGLASGTLDGEGVPKRRRLLLDRGVLPTYLHNSYTANKAGVEDTAHASWGGGGRGITVCNLIPTLGDLTEAELIAGVEEGIYISDAELAADAVTGDISTTIDFGFKIERGRLAYPIAAAMINANIFELLASIDAISSDYRAEPGQVLPSVRVRDVQIIGEGG
jgi:PmbA protein